MKFKQNFRIGIREIDLNDEITNYGILAFLEDVATYHSDTVGYGVKDIPVNKGAWIIMDWELEVYKRPKFGDIIHTTTNAVSMEKTSFHCYRNFEVFNEKNELIATATSKWVYYNLEQCKITKLEPEDFTKFNPEGDWKESESKLLKLKEPDSYENILEYQVQRFDIDIVKHMNNLNYLKLAYETIPEDVFFKQKFDNVRITYKHQIKLGNKVKCFYSKQDDGHYITIKSEDETKTHSIIELW